MNQNLISLPKDQYDLVMSKPKAEVISLVLSTFIPVETEMDALKVSILKWKILSENEHLSKKGMYRMGTDTSCCGLCTFYSMKCKLCCEWTGLKLNAVCFKEFDDWLSKVSNSFMTPKSAMRKKAQRVHDVLYDCYKKHAELK